MSKARYWMGRRRAALAMMAGLLPARADHYVNQLVDDLFAWRSEEIN